MGSNDEGVEKVVEMDGKYAYMMESSSIQYLIERNCLVTQIGGNLDNKVTFKVHIWNNLYKIYVSRACIRNLNLRVQSVQCQ